MHYYTRNKVSRAKIKHLKKNFKETLTSQKEKENLDLLIEAYIMSCHIIWWLHLEILRTFCHF